MADDADKGLWLMDAAEREQLKCADVLEAMNSDLMMKYIEDVSPLVR